MVRVECLQNRTGECGGCEILNMVTTKLNKHGIQRDPELIKRTAREIEAKYCPEPGIMQIDKLKPVKYSIW